MYNRILTIPKYSFFLFGPRGTGKSTWLINQFPDGMRIDLLKSTEFLKYKRDPSLLAKELAAVPKSMKWIIIDEIQLLPELLNEVHAIMQDCSVRFSFALSGSSARKLKRRYGNLLAGRALNKKMFALTSQELGARFDVNRAIALGTLPFVYDLSKRDAAETLDAYIETYLKEEIQQEALVRNVDSFFRFLQVAAIANAQILNIANVARDVGVARSTVQSYFDIAIDTLIGWYLPALQMKAKIKEIAHAKFYLFDCGVQRALSNRHRASASPEEKGHLFETMVLNEIRALNSYRSLGWNLSYWRTESGNEVDLVLSRGKEFIGVEIKHKKEWKNVYNSGLRVLLDEKKIKKAYGIFIGDHALKTSEATILPLADFVDRLGNDKIF